jgi:heme exporter protein CcmD
MNPWPFVIAAYGVTIGLTAALILWSLTSMRRSEARVEGLRRK